MGEGMKRVGRAGEKRKIEEEAQMIMRKEREGKSEVNYTLQEGSQDLRGRQEDDDKEGREIEMEREHELG